MDTWQFGSSATAVSMGWRGDAPPFYPRSDHTARDRAHMSLIMDRLFICNFKGAEDTATLKEHGVTHICSVGEEFMLKSTEQGGGFVFWNKDITDDEHQGAVMAESLRDAALFIKKGLAGGGAVLVHCAAGISRSATVVIGYLILHENHSLRSAFAHVYERRSCIWPNEGFLASLVTLEVEVRGGQPSISATEYDQWGDWDGPVEDGADEGVPRFGPPRLVRDETCEDAEAAELDALDEASARRQLLLAMQGGSTVLDEPSSDASAVRSSDTSSRPSVRRSSLSKAERASAATIASEEARASRDSSRAQAATPRSLAEGSMTSPRPPTVAEEEEEPVELARSSSRSLLGAVAAPLRKSMRTMRRLLPVWHADKKKAKKKKKAKASAKVSPAAPS